MATYDASFFARYHRQLILPEVGIGGQKKLLRSSVAIIGCGGLGSSVIPYLAAAGIGRLVLFDDDYISDSNLNRQIIYATRDLKEKKAEKAASYVNQLNPYVNTLAVAERFDYIKANKYLSSIDVIIDCCDGLPIKFLLNDISISWNKPLIHSSTTGFLGQVLTISPYKGPCLRCIFEEIPEQGTVPSCKQTGIIGASCGIVGSIAALEAIKLLLGIETSLIGTLLKCNFLSMEFKRFSFEQNKFCIACGENPTVDPASPKDYELSSCKAK